MCASTNHGLIMLHSTIFKRLYAANIFSLKSLDPGCRAPLHANVYETLKGLLTIRTTGKTDCVEVCDQLNDNSHRAYYYLQAVFR